MYLTFEFEVMGVAVVEIQYLRPQTAAASDWWWRSFAAIYSFVDIKHQAAAHSSPTDQTKAAEDEKVHKSAQHKAVDTGLKK